MKTKSFRKYLEERFDEKTIREIEEQADAEAEYLKNLQEEVSKAVAAYMSEQKIGFNELVKRLGTSPSQIAKIQRGEANLTLATLAHFGSLIGKRPKVVFE
jgi:plasmid maintenance system antidote protein VapI